MELCGYEQIKLAMSQFVFKRVSTVFHHTFCFVTDVKHFCIAVLNVGKAVGYMLLMYALDINYYKPRPACLEQAFY